MGNSAPATKRGCSNDDAPLATPLGRRVASAAKNGPLPSVPSCGLLNQSLPTEQGSRRELLLPGNVLPLVEGDQSFEAFDDLYTQYVRAATTVQPTRRSSHVALDALPTPMRPATARRPLSSGAPLSSHPAALGTSANGGTLLPGIATRKAPSGNSRTRHTLRRPSTDTSTSQAPRHPAATSLPQSSSASSVGHDAGGAATVVPGEPAALVTASVELRPSTAVAISSFLAMLDSCRSTVRKLEDAEDKVAALNTARKRMPSSAPPSGGATAVPLFVPSAHLGATVALPEFAPAPDTASFVATHELMLNCDNGECPSAVCSFGTEGESLTPHGTCIALVSPKRTPHPPSSSSPRNGKAPSPSIVDGSHSPSNGLRQRTHCMLRPSSSSALSSLRERDRSPMLFVGLCRLPTPATEFTATSCDSGRGSGGIDGHPELRGAGESPTDVTTQAAELPRRGPDCEQRIPSPCGTGRHASNLVQASTSINFDAQHLPFGEKVRSQLKDFTSHEVASVLDDPSSTVFMADLAVATHEQLMQSTNAGRQSQQS